MKTLRSSYSFSNSANPPRPPSHVKYIAQVETLAARRVMEFALKVGIRQAIVEGNSEIIFKDLINFEPSLVLHGHLILDAKLLTS